MREDLAAIAALESDLHDTDTPVAVLDDAALARLAEREWSPLGAIESVRTLIRAVDVGRDDEAQPVLPMATISVTEDMATCMKLHELGWRTAYHHENLAHGLAPEDAGTMLTQRLRWAQGTIQVMFRENPLLQRGLTLAQRLMYWATMWSYLSGFAAVVYIAAPVIYLVFGVMPVQAYSWEFFGRLVPFLVLNQLVFFVVSRGTPTWRGQQYSLALFPVWIKACWTAVLNVYAARPLGFAVTPKTRQEHGATPVVFGAIPADRDGSTRPRVGDRRDSSGAREHLRPRCRCEPVLGRVRPGHLECRHPRGPISRIPTGGNCMIEFESRTTDEGVAVVRPAGRLNMVAAPRLRELLRDVVDGGTTRVVVDLSATDFIDSSGLGALIAGLKAARQAGGDLRIAQPTEQVETVLALTNLNRVLRTHDSVDAAFDGR